MTDYISREAANEACREAVRRYPNSFYNGIEAARDAIRKLPAANVRPVVTCGECKYWEISKIEPPFHVCTYVCGATFVRSTGDFCSRGEKREKS